MCRLLGYLGSKIQLNKLLYEPEHSLVVQSYQPQEMTAGLLNADGFGIGWYHPTKETTPYTYKNILPIWSDINLPQISRYVESKCILGYVRSATPPSSVDLSNCQPFTWDKLLFIHNGFICNFRQTLYRPLRKSLDDDIYQLIQGTTDSEHIFALILQELKSKIFIATALGKVLTYLTQLAQSYQVDFSANIILSNGNQLIASRYSHGLDTPSLYWLKDQGKKYNGVIIASEPLIWGKLEPLSSRKYYQCGGRTLKYVDIQSPREAIESALHQCRQLTLDLWADMDRDSFYQQAHPDFSPVGWHFGHIAFTEAYWILEQLAGYKLLWTQYKTLFAADGLPKQERQHLPPRETIQDYLHTVRSKVLNYFTIAPIQKQARLWYWLIQHESQHSETISFLLQLQRLKSPCYPPSSTFSSGCLRKATQSEMVKIPGGEFLMGSNAIDTQDNERPGHSVYLDTYWIDTYLVTCGEYGEFIAAGGYQKREFWSEVGWEWLQLRPNPVNQPLYCSDPNHPVCGVSWYEAEWEKAASWDEAKGEKLLYPWENTGSYCNCNGLVGKTTPVNAYPQGKSPAGCYDMLGNVWEWTSSWFDGYEGFESYPYPGYSQAYFDRQHRVLRGGSWGTRSWGLRCSFRNWYHPWVRQIFAGFRCVNH